MRGTRSSGSAPAAAAESEVRAVDIKGVSCRARRRGPLGRRAGRRRRLDEDDAVVEPLRAQEEYDLLEGFVLVPGLRAQRDLFVNALADDAVLRDLSFTHGGQLTF